MIFARLLILGLIAFEFLNFFGILNFTLDFSWLGLTVTSIGALVITEAVYYLFRKGGTILPALPYYFVVLSIGFDAVGDIGHFYGNFSWYDQVAHILGGGAVMSVALGILSRYREKYQMTTLFMLAVCLAFTALLGDLYEIEEYLEDVLYHGRQVRLGDGPDTANDLLLNLTGGIIAGVIYILSIKKFAPERESQLPT